MRFLLDGPDRKESETVTGNVLGSAVLFLSELREDRQLIRAERGSEVSKNRRLRIRSHQVDNGVIDVRVLLQVYISSCDKSIPVP